MKKKKEVLWVLLQKERVNDSYTNKIALLNNVKDFFLGYTVGIMTIKTMILVQDTVDNIIIEYYGDEMQHKDEDDFLNDNRLLSGVCHASTNRINSSAIGAIQIFSLLILYNILIFS